MKRFLKVFPILILTCSLFCPAGYAKSKKKLKGCDAGKKVINCPVAKIKAKGIKGCPDTGCGTVDPLLNQQKNIDEGDPESAESKDFQYLVDLPNKVAGYDKIGDPRDKLRDKGEGKMIRVMAFALDARRGSKESCNCGLQQAKNTDNHIVLVEEETLKLKAKGTPARPPSAAHPKGVKARDAIFNTLKRREANSQTAEFAPRVRLDHPKLVGADLKALISKAPKRALLVRVTGLQMYDSEHALGCHKLLRHNDWEIHPVFKLEFCPKGKTCTANSDANWEDMEGQQ